MKSLNRTGVKYQKQTINDIVIDEVDLQPIRFQGQFFDSETGLHYNRFRYYDNDLGMFVSRDPIGLSGGFNVFAYALNPTGWVDPLGLVTLDEAELSLKKAIPKIKPKDVYYMRSSIRNGGSFRTPKYSKKQKFNEWYELEIRDKSWLQELNDRKCPQNMNDAVGENWEDLPSTTGFLSKIHKKRINIYHKGGSFEVRSVPTKHGHSNQCIYNKNLELMTNIPSAGTADRVAVKHSFDGHNSNDMEPFDVAEELDKKASFPGYESFEYRKKYYEVRPIIKED